MNCEIYKKMEHSPLRQAWIDQRRKLISFHPIDSGQLMEAIEPLFWENIISLSNIGYHIQ